MRTISIFSIALFILIFSSCKDEVTSNKKNTPGPWGDTTLLFSDSLGLFSSDSGNVGLIDSVLYNLDSAFMQLRLDYHLKSTGGIAPDNIYYEILISTPDSVFYADYGTLGSSIDISVSKIMNIMSRTEMKAKFKVAILSKGNYSYRDVYLKNIKLYSIIIITP